MPTSASAVSPQNMKSGSFTDHGHDHGHDHNRDHDDDTPESRPLIAPKKRAIDTDQSSIVSQRNGSSSSFTVSLSSSTERRRLKRRKDVARLACLVFATVAAMCAGSISTFSLYAPKLQSRLRYSQFQVNGVAIGSSVALYLPVSAMGLVCDRVGMPPMALLSAFLFAGGYGLAASIYGQLDHKYNHSPRDGGLGGGDVVVPGLDDNGWSYPLMVVAFVMIGAGTCAMYIASLSACAKNFGKGRFRGLALAMPIAGFGLSGMWLSQLGTRVFYEEGPDGSRDVDVFAYFVFLAVLLFAIGIAGTFFLRVIDEEELIDEAIEELEHSGLLTRPEGLHDDYGATASAAGAAEGDLDPHHHEDQARLKKSYLLNAETRRFLTDRTMWAFALAFLLMIGPGEAFVNNLGTVIGTLASPASEEGAGNHNNDFGINKKTSVATHVSLFGVASTFSRLMIGSLTDILAPSPETATVQLSSSTHSTHSPPSSPGNKRLTISRIVFLLFFGCLLAVGLLFLASGAAQGHAERFWVVSALVGAGYGALFSLTPIIVTVIWGVENFATNYGIIVMLPAVGSTFWGLVYSAVYEAGRGAGEGGDALCHGRKCYATAFWAEGTSVLAGCAILAWVWKGRAGWSDRGIVI